MTRVGFLGCAHVHAGHYLQELSRPDVPGTAAAVFDHDRERAARFAHASGLQQAATAAELCAEVDAVIITAEHVRYPDLVAEATAAGIPVLCEKPTGVSIAAARSLLAADHAGWVSVAFPVRYAHPIRQAKKAIGARQLGALLAMSGVNRAAPPGGFFAEQAQAGGGAVIDHVVHLADTLRWLTGCHYSTVYAEASNVRGDGDVEDSAQVLLTTTEGAWVSIDPSWSRPHNMAGHVDFEMTLWFEGGQIQLDAFARTATVVAKDGSVHFEPYGVGMNQAMITDWLTACRDGAPPPVSVMDGWRATQAALGALRSAETGRVVDLTSQEWTLE